MTAQNSDQAPNLPQVRPPADVFENDEAYLVRADVPGVTEDDLSIKFHKGELSFTAKRSADELAPLAYKRAFRFPDNVQSDEIKASLNDGVLELHLPKSPEVRPRQIKLTA